MCHQEMLTSMLSRLSSCTMVEDPSTNAGDTRNAGSIPGLGRNSGAGNGNLLQYSCLENSMDRGAWQTTVQGVRHD